MTTSTGLIRVLAFRSCDCYKPLDWLALQMLDDLLDVPFQSFWLFQAVQGKKLPPWASEFDCTTWAQFFLKYIVSHPAVTCAVPGMAKIEYVADNLAAAQGRLPDAAMRRRMDGNRKASTSHPTPSSPTLKAALAE